MGGCREGAMKEPGQEWNDVILFDGVCGLCVPAVRLVIRYDREARFRFASLQSEAGQELARRYGIDPDSLSSVVLIEEGRAYVESDAALRIARRLRRPISWLRVLRILPAALRDAVYRVVARRRYRWFGTLDACWNPPEKVRVRMLP